MQSADILYNFLHVVFSNGVSNNRRHQISHMVDYIIVEGNMLTEMSDVMVNVDRLVFLTLNQVRFK